MKGKIMTTKPSKRTPLRIALLATLVGLLGTVLLFGGRSQATPSVEMCDGKGCVECNNSTQECPEPPAPSPEPPAPTPTPAPSPEPSVTPTPAPTPEPSPEPSVTPGPTPSPEPSTPPAPTPKPTPSTPEPNPTPDLTPTPIPSPTPTPEPPAQSFLAKTGASASNLTYAAFILAASGCEIWIKARQKRRA